MNEHTSQDSRNSRNASSPNTVTPIPFGNEFEKALRGLIVSGAKDLFKQAVNLLVQMLAAGSDPFFRRQMGERYFSPASLTAGSMLWLLTGVISCYSWKALGAIVSLYGWAHLASFFRTPVMPIVSAVVSLALLITYRRLGAESLKLMEQYRSEGTLYHSRSYGVPRWEDPTKLREAQIKLLIGLIFLAPVAGIALIFSMSMSASYARQQQRAFYDRYLDTMDARIESEVLRDALLGKQPLETTNAHKTLPQTKNPQVREDIASAAVGKTIRVVAQGPILRNPSAAPAPQQQSYERAITEPAAPVNTAGTKSAASASTQKMPQKSKLPLFVILIVVGALSVFGIYKMIRPSTVQVSSTSHETAKPAPAPLSQQAIPTTAPQATVTTATPSVAITSDAPARVKLAPVMETKPQTPVVTHSEVVPVAPTNIAVVPTITPEQQKQIERQKIEKCLIAIHNLTLQQIAAITNLDQNGRALLEEQRRATSYFYPKQRKILKETVTKLEILLTRQLETINGWSSITESFPRKSAAFAERQLEEITAVAKELTQQRYEITGEIKRLATPNGTSKTTKIP